MDEPQVFGLVLGRQGIQGAVVELVLPAGERVHMDEAHVEGSQVLEEMRSLARVDPEVFTSEMSLHLTGMPSEGMLVPQRP